MPAASKSKLLKLRNTINRVDGKLLRLMAERRRLAREVAESKQDYSLPFRDMAREAELLAGRIQSAKKLNLDPFFVTRIFHELIDDSLRIQQEYLQSALKHKPGTRLKVAIQGGEGSYSLLVAQKHFSLYGRNLEVLGLPDYKQVLNSVEIGQSDYALVPLESSASGMIHEVYDLLQHSNLYLVGEDEVQTEHCLVGRKNCPLERVRHVFAHPYAISQCSNFLSLRPKIKLEYCANAALAAKLTAQKKSTAFAAIAGAHAARYWGLSILKRGIANISPSITRYGILARSFPAVDGRMLAKTSLIMATLHKPGSLAEALLVFKQHKINLTKLISRALPNPQEELFYLDLEGNLESGRVRRALNELKAVTRFIKILGCYPARDARKSLPDTGA